MDNRHLRPYAFSMKNIFLILTLLSSSMAFASSTFNGVFCGRGYVDLNGKVYQATKVLEIYASSSSLQLVRSRAYLDTGGYIEGKPENASVENGEIIYEGKTIGTISDDEVKTSINISGYDIEYLLKNLTSGRISYLRTSENKGSSFYMIEKAPELTKGSCPSFE